MNDAKYIGLDVHQATISAAVRDSSGSLVMEATLETKAETILEFVHGLRGSLRVSFEEGTCAEATGNSRFAAKYAQHRFPQPFRGICHINWRGKVVGR